MISLKGPGLRLFAAILLVVAFLTLRERKAVRALKETGGETRYLSSEKGEERELYFSGGRESPLIDKSYTSAIH